MGESWEAFSSPFMGPKMTEDIKSSYAYAKLKDPQRTALANKEISEAIQETGEHPHEAEAKVLRRYFPFPKL